MDLYNPHSLLDEAVEVDSSSEGESSRTASNKVSLAQLMQSTRLSPDELDLEKIVVTGVLFVIAFFVLMPRKPIKRFRKRVDSKERIHHVMPGSSPTTTNGRRHHSSPDIHHNNTLICKGMVMQEEEDDVEEETEEEKFIRNWPAIRTSPYRRLVLSPECRHVHLTTTNRIMLQQQQKEKSIHNAKQQLQEEDLDEDHPLKRLRRYMENFLDLVKNILSYEYLKALLTVIQWLTACIRLRKRHYEEEQEEEEDDDDASAYSKASVTNSPTQREFKSPNNNALPPASPPNIQEEKKDMNEDLHPDYARQKSGVSVYEVPLNDGGDSDEPPPPPSIPRLSLQNSKRSSLKRKDALESYRGSSSQGALVGQYSQSAPLAPKVHPPSAFGDGGVSLSSDDVLPSRELASQPAHKRSESDHSMSYFDAAHSRDVLKKMSVEVPVPDVNGYILGDEFLPNSRHTPLLVFVNSRSGPQQGQLLITQLRRLMNPIQVWDLADGGPEKILESFSVFSRLRILVCGGDGTVSWIISALEKMKLEKWPPIAILPLGTGNDLARIHGWGGGYTNESLIQILEQIADSYISLLDRWEMTVENKKGKVKEAKSFTNYLGVGVDAQAALQVHMLRETMPKFFFSRFVNKAWYALFGAEDAIKATHANLPHEICLIADGVEVPLPADSQGIILLNIDSYAGGIPMWSHATKPGATRTRDDLFHLGREGDALALRRSQSADSITSRSKSNSIDRVDSLDDLTALLSDEEKQARLAACDMPSSCQDGMLDIVSIRGAFHLGQIRVGLSHAQRLCQCSEVTIIIKKRTAIHIDGEPWRQTAGTLHVRRKKEPAIMLHRSNDESGGVETEMAKLLDWAEERQIIDRNVHSTLMKEFSRRIESKTRQRRVRSQENLMLTLSRALQQNSFPNASGGNTGGTFPNSIAF